MEWLWKLIDHLQKSIALSALQSFKPFDWVVLVLILWGLLQGSRKGFSDMFGKLLGIFLVSMATLGLYEKGAVLLSSHLPMISLKIAESFVFLILAVFLWLSVSWCVNAFGKIFKVEAQGILKSLGGMVFGGMRMLLLLSFFAQLLLFMLPITFVQDTFKAGHTYTGYAISRVAPDLYQLIVGSFRKTVLKKSPASDKVGG